MVKHRIGEDGREVNCECEALGRWTETRGGSRFDPGLALLWESRQIKELTWAVARGLMAGGKRKEGNDCCKAAT